MACASEGRADGITARARELSAHPPSDQGGRPWQVSVASAESKRYAVQGGRTANSVRSDCGLGFLAWREALSESPDIGMLFFATAAPPDGSRIQGSLHVAVGLVEFRAEDGSLLCSARRQSASLWQFESPDDGAFFANVRLARQGRFTQLRDSSGASQAMIAHKDHAWQLWRAIARPFYPRTVKVLVPPRTVAGDSVEDVDLEAAYNVGLRCDFHALIAKPPTWSQSRRTWTLQYDGRACLPADINVQLVVCDDDDVDAAGKRDPCFSLGLVDHVSGVCTLDYEAPLSAHQALAVALAIMDKSLDVTFF